MKRPPGWIAVLPALWVLLGVVALLAIGAMLAPVRSQERNSIPVACIPTEQVRAALGNIGEHVMARGATVANAIVELWANPRTRTFTVIVRLPGGASCMVISGDGLEQGEMPKDDPS